VNLSNNNKDTFIKSVFIEEPFNAGWIIEKLMNDLKSELTRRGINVDIGTREDYKNQQIVLHSRSYYYKKIAKAEINSVFMTHIDSLSKEFEMKAVSNDADSIICMSEDQAALMSSLGFKNRVIGINLPHRGGFIKRPKLGIFSACYGDERKNEKWLIDYLKSLNEIQRNSLIISLIGHNWENFALELSKLNISFEIYRYSRTMPGEYEIQKEIISDLDYLLYMGFDGGSMSIYDGIFANINLIISNQCYHKGIKGALLFDDNAEFCSILDDIVLSTSTKEEMINERNIENYASKLIEHWLDLLGKDTEFNSDYNLINAADSNEAKKYRSKYRNFSILENIRSIYRSIVRRF